MAPAASGKFGHGFASAGFTAGLSPALANMNTVSATIASALIGGTISAATGGKFANGAVTSAMQVAMGKYVLNNPLTLIDPTGYLSGK